MSADNGVYIAKFPNGYRISFASAIENIDYYPPNTQDRRDVLKEYFGASEVYPTLDLAVDAAFKIYNKVESDGFYVEYGVCEIGEYELFELKEIRKEKLKKIIFIYNTTSKKIL